MATPMSSVGRESRWIHIALRVLAIVFAAAAVLYTYFLLEARWLDQPSAVELGLDFPYSRSEHALVVSRFKPDSPAERAGLRIGDKVVALEGNPVRGQFAQRKAYWHHVPGDKIHLTVVRPGETAPLDLTATFRANSDPRPAPGSLQNAATQFLENSLPLFFAAVGLVILMLRPDDRNVWLLASFFAGIVASIGFPHDFQSVPAPLRVPVEVYRGIFFGMLGASFYFLCAVFPVRSPIDRRLPWLKWMGVILGLMFAGEMRYPDVSAPVPTFSWFLSLDTGRAATFGIAFGFLTLGLLSLAATFFVAREPESRRKIRVIFWGTVVGFGPSLLRAGAAVYTGFRSPPWLEVILNSLLMLVPASFAYAVFKQRVLDIPVLLQRSARYVLVQRGFLLLLCFFSVGLTLAFAASIAHLPMAFEMDQTVNTALGALFGTALLWGGTRIHSRVSGRIDHAFFRSAYDIRVILENLAASSRTAASREALAELLMKQLNASLQPASLAVYLATNDQELETAAGKVPPELRTLTLNSPILTELAHRGEPWELPPSGLDQDPATAMLAPLHSGCLVPVLGREGRLVGLLALGPRLSEEPYSGEDKRLLASVASQAGMAIENFRLAESIAEKLEIERRAAREMEIAKDVQTRLLPQAVPKLRTLDCAGQCLQARRVGGDYYDFLELGREQVGLVLADVSGKGVHAALLMANLQAHLRSLSGLTSGNSDLMTPFELVSTLQQVNRIVWKSTAAEHYATLFFGLYDDATRRLTYVNCGHNPPILLRTGGDVERLKPTATVIGVFEKWECTAREAQLGPGDQLAIFSDGVTEAMLGEHEFGEPRLLDELRRTRELPVAQVVTNVFNAVQQFSAGNQSDDLTLLVARAK